MLKNEDLEILRCMLSPYHSNIIDFQEGLEEMIENCDEDPRREKLILAVNGLEMAIRNIREIVYPEAK